MVLYGADVSSYQGKFNIGNLGFIIAKATEGASYINPFCDYVVQQAIKKKKPWGFYHYFTGIGYKQEVDYYLKNTWKGYGKKGLPCFDWERGSNREFGNGTYLKNAVDYFHDKTGVWPVIYCTAEAARSLSSTGIFKNCALWCAGYPYNNGSWKVPPFIYQLPKGVTMILWQFDAADGLDKNISYIDAKTWAKYCNPSSKSKTSAKSSSKSAKSSSKSAKTTTLESLAKDVIKGKYGSGNRRMQKLGKYAQSVQAIVNYKLKAINYSSCISTLKVEVLKGNLGNGALRKSLLGKYYNDVQKRIG